MKVTILGCGASTGVPVVGCDCDVCCSDDPKNKRTRCSIYVEDKGVSLLVDTSPDFRFQALQHSIKKVDAVLYTHPHFDHISGVDELRSFNFIQNCSMDVYADKVTMDELQKRFNHAFLPPEGDRPWVKPSLIPHEVEPGKMIDVSGLSVLAFIQIHGNGTSLGYRFGDFAYSTDVNMLDEEAYGHLKGVKTWVVDCLSYEASPTHSHLEQTLEWIKRVSPERTVLTHMGHKLDYARLSQQLPSGVEAAYDGMVLYL